VLFRGLRGNAASLAAMLVVSSGLTLSLFSVSASAAPPSMQVMLKFDGSGMFSATNGMGTDTPEHADVALKWSAVYTGTLGTDGSLTLQAAAGSATGEGGLTTAPPPGAFHYTSTGLFMADCSGPLPLAPGAPSPAAAADGGVLNVQSVTSVDQNDATGQVNCQGTGPQGDSTDLSAQAANLAGAFGPSLPDVLAARIDLPAEALKSGSFTKDVSSADAPAQLPSSCSSQFGEPEGQCQMSLHWSGVIQISVLCGQVSFSEGDTLPVGAIVTWGQTVSTGPKSRLEITLSDGSLYRLGPSSVVQCDGQSNLPPHEQSISDRFRLILGHMWGATESALGGHSFNDGDCPPDIECKIGGGVRGSAFTASIMPGGKVLFHVIEGTGFVRIKGKREFDFPAGEGVVLYHSHYTVTTIWPTADQLLVPAAQRPPAIIGIHLDARHGGRTLTLHLKLSQNATVRVQIMRGKRRVLTKKISARHGATSIHLRSLPSGRYTLTLFAAAHGRSVAIQKAVRI
jgi:hypothetical protein